MHYDSPLGGMTMTANGTALTGLWFDEKKRYVRLPGPEAKEQTLPVFDDARRWLDAYFSGKAPDFVPPLRMETTDFRREVWQLLLAIPYGKTVTYGALAAAMAHQRGVARMSAQAVGGAVGHNCFTVIVPCHRVVGADGSLTGYAGGLERKIRLLELEGVDTSAFTVPAKGTAL